MTMMMGKPFEPIMGHGASSFVLYCKDAGQGSSGYAAQARICVQVGGATARACIKRLERQLAGGALDSESYRIRVEAVQTTQARYKRGVGRYIDPCTVEGGWHLCGEGSHRRIKFGGSHGRNNNMGRS